MKKTLVAVILLLAFSVLSASAGIIVKPYTLDTVLDSYTDIAWQHQSTGDGNGNTTITRTANLDGRPYEIGIIGSNDRVTKVYFSGWFADMEMQEGIFPDGLHAYNDCLRACLDFLPDEEDVDYVFSAYDIYRALSEGSSWFEGESFEGWQLVSTGAGSLIMRHGEGSEVEAQRTADGRIWLEITY